MYRVLGVAILFLCSASLTFGQNTPPAGDQVGSDRAAQQGTDAQYPSNDPRTNQRVTGTMGSTSGKTGSAAYAGKAGTAYRTNTQTGASAGEQTRTQPAESGKASQGKARSDWDTSATRGSNIVGRMSQRNAGKKKTQSKTREEQPKKK